MLDVDAWPLTAVDVMPLHLHAAEDPYVCQFPERPYDGSFRFDWRCRSCVVYADAVVRQGDDPLQTWYPAPDAPPVDVPLSWLVERARYWGVL